MACTRCATGSGGAGGAVFATTARAWIAAGGRTVAVTRPPVKAARCGTAGGVIAATGALATTRASTCTKFLDTEPPPVKAVPEVATTAPGTRWFT